MPWCSSRGGGHTPRRWPLRGVDGAVPGAVITTVVATGPFQAYLSACPMDHVTAVTPASSPRGQGRDSEETKRARPSNERRAGAADRHARAAGLAVAQLDASAHARDIAWPGQLTEGERNGHRGMGRRYPRWLPRAPSFRSTAAYAPRARALPSREPRTHRLMAVASRYTLDRDAERRQAAALARRYRDDERLPTAEIARRLGRALATVKAYLYEPTGEEAPPSRSPPARPPSQRDARPRTPRARSSERALRWICDSPSALSETSSSELSPAFETAVTLHHRPRCGHRKRGNYVPTRVVFEPRLRVLEGRTSAGASSRLPVTHGLGSAGDRARNAPTRRSRHSRRIAAASPLGLAQCLPAWQCSRANGPPASMRLRGVALPAPRRDVPFSPGGDGDSRDSDPRSRTW